MTPLDDTHAAESGRSPQRFPAPLRRTRTGSAARAHDVTFVISDLGGGGAQRVLATLTETWAEAGLRVCVITFAHEHRDKYALPSNVTRMSLRRYGHPESVGTERPKQETAFRRTVRKHAPAKSTIRKCLEFTRGVARSVVRVLKIRAILKLAQDIRLLRSALRRADSTVVLAFMTSSNVKAIFASAGLDARVVVSERTDVSKQPRNWPWHVLRRWVYRYADAVTANSLVSLKSMEEFVPPSKLIFVPNPLAFPIVPGADTRREKTILNVGRLHRQKAQDVLLQAYAQVVSAAPEWRLAIVGYGAEKKNLHDQAAALGLLDKVDWVEWTSDIERYYREAGIFALPSRFEGTPNALLEAMSFGLPSIVSDSSPGSLQHIVDGENGLVVPVEDADRLARAILMLIESEALRERLGGAAQRTMAAYRDGVEEAWARALGWSDGAVGEGA